MKREVRWLSDAEMAAWRSVVRFSTGLLALLAGTLVVLSSVAAHVGARTATAIGAVRAVREDW